MALARRPRPPRVDLAIVDVRALPLTRPGPLMPLLTPCYCLPHSTPGGPTCTSRQRCSTVWTRCRCLHLRSSIVPYQPGSNFSTAVWPTAPQVPSWSILTRCAHQGGASCRLAFPARITSPLPPQTRAVTAHGRARRAAGQRKTMGAGVGLSAAPSIHGAVFRRRWVPPTMKGASYNGRRRPQ